LDLQSQVVDSTAVDPFLDRQNLGLGNYKEREMWQQVESYRHGMYATAAFRRLIDERAKREAQTEMAIDGYSLVNPQTGNEVRLKGWEEMSPEEREETWAQLRTSPEERIDRRRWIQRRGVQLYEKLEKMNDSEQRRWPATEAVRELAGHSGSWDPAHNRMLMARHETSRSRGAQLLDNVFGRVKEHVTDGNSASLREGRK